MQTQQLQTKSFLRKNKHSKTIKSNKKVIISQEVVWYKMRTLNS